MKNYYYTGGYFARKFLLILLLCVLQNFTYAQDTWSSNTSVAGGAPISFSSDQAAFSIASPSTGPQSTFTILNTATSTWTALPTTPYPQCIFAFAIGLKAYTGFTNGTFYEFNSSTNTWTQKTSYPFSACNLPSTTNPGFALNSQGYVLTFQDHATSGCPASGTISSKIWKYDPVSDQWISETVSTSVNKNYFTIFTLSNKLYVGGGGIFSSSTSQVSNEFWMWDPVSKIWTSKASIPVAIWGGLGFSLCNRGYVFGGRKPYPYVPYWTDNYELYQYNPVSNTWLAKQNTYDNTTSTIFSSLSLSSGAFALGGKGYAITPSRNYIYNPDLDANFTISGIPSGVVCSKAEFDLSFEICTTTAFNAGNVFTAQLSDASGNFTSPANIGTVTTNAPYGVIHVTIPSSANGTGYRIRIVASSPSWTSPNNGSNINIIRSYPNITLYSITKFVTDPNFTLTNGSPSGGTYSGTGVIGGTTFSPSTAGVGTHTLTYTYNQCSTIPQSTVTVINCTPGWSKKADFPAGPVNDAVAGAIGMKGYVVTGTAYTGPYTMDLWEYDYLTNTWAVVNTSFPGTTRYSAMSFVIGNKLYVCGGINSGVALNDCYVWDQSTNTWSSIAALPQACYDGAGFAISGKGYVTTGKNTAGTILNTLYMFDPLTNTWTTKTAFVGAARYGAVAFVVGNIAYVGTGASSTNILSDFYSYNPSTNAWTAITSIPGARRDAVAVTQGGLGWVGTGVDPSINSISNFYSYNPSTNTWTAQTALTGPARSRAVAFNISGTTFITGGMGRDMAVNDKELWQNGNCFNNSTCSMQYLTMCPGNYTYLSTNYVGSFSSGNINTAQLSDANGSFSNPVVVGTSNSMGPILVTIPPGTPAGTQYRMRVVTSDPVTIGYDNGQDITIQPCSTVTGTISNITYCAGNAVTVPFTFTSGYSPTNTNFVAEISDATGVFAVSPPIIGVTAIPYATNSGTINGYIPASSTAGTDYRIRVRDAAHTGAFTDNGTNINIVSQCISLFFDGSDDRVTISDHPAYNLGTNNFTIELRVRPISSQTNASPVIIAKRSGATIGFVIRLINNGTAVSFQAGSTTIQSNTFTSILDNNCHTIVLARNAGNVTFYVDGSGRGTFANNGSISSSGAITLGYDPFVNGFYSGNINDIRFWNIYKTPEAIFNTINTPLTNFTGVAGWWNFKESSGQDVFDGTPIANHGILGTNNTSEPSDAQRSSVFCYNTDRQASDNLTDHTSGISIQPNPFDSETTVNLPSGNYTYYILDLNSKMVEGGNLTSSSNTIGKDLKSGFYILHINTEEGNKIYKIIKQ